MGWRCRATQARSVALQSRARYRYSMPAPRDGMGSRGGPGAVPPRPGARRCSSYPIGARCSVSGDSPLGSVPFRIASIRSGATGASRPQQPAETPAHPIL
jgi:hypothetical protein